MPRKIDELIQFDIVVIRDFLNANNIYCSFIEYHYMVLLRRVIALIDEKL